MASNFKLSHFLCLPWKIITVEPVMFLFMFARGIFNPLYLQYYYWVYGSDILRNTSFQFPSGTYCVNSTLVETYAGNDSYKVVESHSNEMLIYSQLASRIPSTLVVLVLGPLTDRLGRKPVMIMAAFGMATQGAVAIVLIHYKMNVLYFMIAHFVGGVMGGYAGFTTAGFAYVTDISSTKWRSFRLGVLEATFMLAGGLGDFILGFWLRQKNCNFVLPLWLFLACNLGAIAYVLFIPESLPKEKREKTKLKNPQMYLQGIKIYFGKIPQYQAWRINVANIFYIISIFALGGAKMLTVYFLKALPFDFDTFLVGIYELAQALSRTVSNSVLLVILVALKVPDAVIGMIGLAVTCICYLLTGLAKKHYQIFIIVSFQGASTISWTAVRSIMSKSVSSEDLGALYSVIAATEAVAMILSSIVWPIVFPLTLKYNLTAGTTYILISGVALLGLPLLITLLCTKNKYSQAPKLVNFDPNASTVEENNSTVEDSTGIDHEPTEEDQLLGKPAHLNHRKYFSTDNTTIN